MKVHFLLTFFQLFLFFSISNAEKSFNAGHTIMIVNGSVVTKYDRLAQFVVQIFKVNSAQKSISICTGNFITHQHILTAAHCLAQKPDERNYIYYSLEIPEDFFRFFQEQSNSNLLKKPSQIFIHPRWLNHPQIKPITDWYDLGIIQVDQNSPISIKPIPIECLSLYSRQVTIAGYGSVDGIQHTKSQNLRKKLVSIDQQNWSLTEFTIDSSQGGACHGDSGGPALQFKNNEWYLVGIDSRSELESDPHFECNGKTIYTHIYQHIEWIQSIIHTTISTPILE